MKVGMGECWLQKERDSELADPPSQTVFQGRNTYSFWSPLDEEFLLCMAKVGHWKQFEFIDPFWTDYYFAYLDYTNEQSKISGLSEAAASPILNADENAAAYAALAAGTATNTGLAYQEYSRTNPPTLNLKLTNGNSLNLTWTPVAVHYLLEQTNNLLASNWTALTIPTRPVGADYAATIQATNQAGFIRLHLP
jgi:hypothetical protein